MELWAPLCLGERCSPGWRCDSDEDEKMNKKEKRGSVLSLLQACSVLQGLEKRQRKKWCLTKCKYHKSWTEIQCYLSLFMWYGILTWSINSYLTSNTLTLAVQITCMHKSGPTVHTRRKNKNKLYSWVYCISICVHLGWLLWLNSGKQPRKCCLYPILMAL